LYKWLFGAEKFSGLSRNARQYFGVSLFFFVRAEPEAEAHKSYSMMSLLKVEFRIKRVESPMGLDCVKDTWYRSSIQPLGLTVSK